MGSGILSAPNSIDRLVKPERINCPTKDATIGEEEDIDDDLEDSCEVYFRKLCHQIHCICINLY